jgi:signal transduction histidine kinase
MPTECPGDLRDQESRQAGAAREPRPTAGLQRITLPAAIAAILVTVISVGLALPGRPAPVVAGAIAALLVAAGGTAFVLFGRSQSTGPNLAVLVAVGSAGAALAQLVPSAPGSVMVYVALAGIGMIAPPAAAIMAGLVVFGALNLAALLGGTLPILALISEDIGATFVFAVAAFTRSSRIVQEQARVAQARAEDLLAQLQAAQATQAEAVALTERARLAREIHDILAHALSGLVLALDTMELLGRQADAGPDTMARMMEQVSRGQRIARDGLADTRRAIAALRGDELPGPVLLDRLVRDTAAATGVRAVLSVVGPERPLPPEVGLALYRTAQEALTNTAKYAGQGAGAELRLAYEEDAVELVIEDSRTEDPPDTAAGLTFGGYGLTGMRERAELLGGSLTAGPTGSGFAVRLRLPARAAATLPGSAASGLANGLAP